MSNNNNGFGENAIIGLATGVGVAFAFFFGFLYAILATGFVSVQLWSWFIVPVFDLPALTLLQAWGISLLVGLWTHQVIIMPVADERSTSEKIMGYFVVLLNPWIILFVGWIVKTVLM